MRRSDLLTCSGCTVQQYTTFKNRQQLPFEIVETRSWQDFSLKDAFNLHIMLDLTGGGSEEMGGLRPKDACKIVKEAVNKFSQHPLLQVDPAEWWIGVLVFEESDEAGDDVLRAEARACDWQGLTEQLAQIESEQEQRPVRVFLVNATRAADYVLRKADELGLSEYDRRFETSAA